MLTDVDREPRALKYELCMYRSRSLTATSRGQSWILVLGTLSHYPRASLLQTWISNP
jgi:hypothetical protein